MTSAPVLDEGEREEIRRAAWEAAASVADPEVPVLTIVDLGVLRDVAVGADGSVRVVITPTYSGCPAMNVISFDIELAVQKAGLPRPEIVTALSPAWTTDWIGEEGRRKLAAYGIAPPAGRAAGRRALFGELDVACPRCGSSATTRIAEFGSTACKALYRCDGCREPFDYFKCI